MNYEAEGTEILVAEEDAGSLLRLSPGPVAVPF